MGVQPDILVLRTEHDIDENMRRKTALFCNVDEDAVIQSIDVPTIYQVPVNLQNQNMDEIILRKRILLLVRNRIWVHGINFLIVCQGKKTVKKHS